MTWLTLEQLEQREPLARFIISDAKRWPDRYPIGLRWERRQRNDGAVYGPIELYDPEAFERVAAGWKQEKGLEQ